MPVARADLPVNIDSAYADDATHPDIKLHQEHHDAIHEFVKTFTDGAIDDGAVWFWNESLSKWVAIDPEIEGSPGPQGIQGHGIRPLGAWNSGTAYTIYNGTSVFADDLVTYLGQVYIATAAHTNSAPTLLTNWALYATKGTDGADGSDGTDGGPGPQGPKGDPGPSQEPYQDFGDVSGDLEIDISEVTMAKITLVGDANITFANTAGTSAGAATLRIYQGAGAPWTVTWVNISHWFTADELEPDLGDTEDQIRVVVADMMASEWFGYSPGTAGTPPPETFGVLAMDDPLVAIGQTSPDVTADGAGLATYALGSSVQIAAKHGGIAVVSSSRGDSGDPPVPSLTGGGVTWAVVQSEIVGVSTNRRRITMFAARESAPAAAAQHIVSLVAAGITHTSCIIIVAQTTGTVPASWLTTILAKGKGRASPNDGGVATVPSLAADPLASPGDAANRTILAVVINSTNTLTPPSGFAILGGTYTGVSSPVHRLHLLFNDSAFVTGPAGSLSGAGAEWGVVASEMEQGPTS